TVHIGSTCVLEAIARERRRTCGGVHCDRFAAHREPRLRRPLHLRDRYPALAQALHARGAEGGDHAARAITPQWLQQGGVLGGFKIAVLIEQTLLLTPGHAQSS